MNELPVFNTISNETLCNWFWVLFIVNFTAFVIYAVVIFVKFYYMKGLSLFMRGVLYLLLVLGMSLATINGGFMFTMCKRAVK